MMARHLKVLLAGLGALALLACSDDEDPGGQGGSIVTTQTGTSAGGTSAGGTGGSGGTSSGGTSAGGTSAGGTSAGGTSAGGTGGSGGSVDQYEAARIACIDKINELRATLGRSPYDRWTSAESCADSQAVSDQAANDPHGAFGQCGENGQNECLGGGAAGIESCLQSMWDERNQAGCSGCDACADAYDPNCPNCDFYGSQTGDVCGHYVNMSANYFSGAACGFASQWAVIDFH